MEVDRSNRRISADWCSELAPGGTPYFTVAYPEPGVNTPEVDTLIYLGSTGISDDEGGQPRIGFLFQEAHSYLEDGDWSTSVAVKLVVAFMGCLMQPASV